MPDVPLHTCLQPEQHENGSFWRKASKPQTDKTTFSCDEQPKIHSYIRTMTPNRLAIIEDEPVIRENLRLYLEAEGAFKVVCSAPSVEDFLSEIKILKPEQMPDALLLDIQLPGMSGLNGIPWIKGVLPKVDIVMLTTFEDTASIFRALRMGATSYLSKQTSLANIAEALKVVQRGGSYMSPSIARKVVEHFSPAQSPIHKLTPRQHQIVQGILDGLSYQDIANQLFISLDTVRSHIKKIYSTLEVSSKTELIHKTMKHNL